jgi:hypothetical protein
MTKWVTFLLLLLAILAYGLSQMRPVPPEQPAVTASSTPGASVTNGTPTPGQASPSPIPSDSNGAAAANSKAPKFGVPRATPGEALASPAATETPSSVAANPKADPFSKNPKKPQPVAGTIKATILSATAGGSSRTKFAHDTSSIYLTATPEGLKDQVEVVASFRSVMDEANSFSDPVTSSGPPRRRTYKLTAPEKGWKSGPYQIILKAKETDQVLGIARFEILSKEEKLPQSYPPPEYLDLVPDLEAEESQASFSKADKEILLRVSAQELGAGTIIRSVWSAVEVDNLTAGELIAVAEQPAPGPGKDAVFTFEAPPSGFHSGSYKVDVYFDQLPAGSQAFFIQPPAKKGSR